MLIIPAGGWLSGGIVDWSCRLGLPVAWGRCPVLMLEGCVAVASGFMFITSVARQPFQSSRPPLPQHGHHLHERVREVTGSKLQVGGVCYMFTVAAYKCAEVTYKLRAATDELTALIS